jgi:hypothetical protein
MSLPDSAPAAWASPLRSETSTPQIALGLTRVVVWASDVLSPHDGPAVAAIGLAVHGVLSSDWPSLYLAFHFEARAVRDILQEARP